MFGQSLLSAFGSAACTTDTDQLFATDVQTTSTATYQLNNATTSIPGNNYPGTPSNITYAAGKFGNAAVFDGGNSVIDISSSAINPASPYTISMWFNADTASTYEGLYTGISSSPVVGELTIVKASATILQTFSVATNGSNTLDANTVTIPTLSSNTWYNVVVIADRSLPYKSRVFINGVEGTNYTVGSASTNLLSTIKVGFADNNYFDGSIDQIRFFPSSLPQVAITALYNETTTTAQSASVDYQLVNPNSIAYYKMSDATDQLGNYNGTATNVNFNTVGKFGFAGGFNGSSSEIVFPSVLSGITNVFSYSCWFKITDLTIPFNTLDDGSNQNTNVINYIPRHSNGNYYITFGAESNRLIGTSPSSYSDGGWHHMVVTKSSSSLKFYSDGVLLDEDTSHTDSVSGLSNAQIAHYSSTFSKGSIDQIRIYDSALSAANVTTLYEEIECPAVTSDTYLVVGGGAGSGSYGGGGAGGYLSNFNRNSIEFTTGTVYTITVGAGGATSSSGGSAGTNGDASVLSGSNITTITASGGGYGGNLVSNISANSGASGGGGASDGAGAGGAASPAGQGNAGGIGAAAHPNYSGGGGGGAGAVGNAGSGATGGNGGVGIETSITGTATYFAGGGGGTGYAYPNPGTSGTGGSGGGGTANPYGSTSTVSNATPNTGGGGGGNGAVYSNGSGGSGIVVLRYSSTKSITIASGSLSTGTLNTSIGSDKYTTFIGGTGTVTFS